jgi:CxxC motif-containing protein (DUF1111 family)
LKRPSITNLIAASLLATFALVAPAQTPATGRPSYWPAIRSDVTPLTEWFSDVPWHQKLGTYAGNEILVPLIFPYEVLPKESIDYCKTPDPTHPDFKFSQEDCMIEVGVGNILGYHRIDTLYATSDSRISATCTTQACTEVRLEISNYMVRSTPTGVKLVAEKIAPMDQARQGLGGFNITDGTTYGPQMLWEMSHYCDSMFALGDMQDPVCYADYFSSMNSGFNNIAGKSFDKWPQQSAAWSVFPMGAPPEPTNHCMPGLDVCVMTLGSFGMGRVPQDAANLQYKPYNELLMTWFSNALVAFPQELGDAEIKNHFPWNGKPVARKDFWKDYIYPLAVQNPFLGSYAPTDASVAPAVQVGCDTGLDGGYQNGVLAPVNTCSVAPAYEAKGFAYPRSCESGDLDKAIGGDLTSIDRLRACGVNYEIHPNGWLAQWPEAYRQFLGANTPFSYDQNEYGRTSFLFGGIPGMQMPVSFYKDSTCNTGINLCMTTYEQVHNASIFSLFLPVANVADVKRAMGGRNYVDTAFYHTLLMSNHMESDPEQFADGIRGKVLWHNEYRMEPMYAERNNKNFPLLFRDRTFQAAFDPLKSKYDASKAPAPFHNNTCDGCHVRNGSGVPINTQYKLDAAMTKEFMADTPFVPFANGHETEKDYTFTGVIRPMKLVFFDLQKPGARPRTSSYSEPLNASETALAAAPRTVKTNELYYNNKIMNFYGDSFHVSPKEGAAEFSYTWSFVKADTSRMVVSARRYNQELQKEYVPQQIKLGTFITPADCQLVLLAPIGKPWPTKCTDIADAAIQEAVTYSDSSTAKVGYMHLNGKRLGNLSVIEAIPNTAIVAFQTDQKPKLGNAVGEIVWSPGSRDGISGTVKPDCRTNSLTDCFIGRFGWLGDRGSLEDQVANAAYVEMNMTSSESYDALYGTRPVAIPIRYKYPNCGPANKTCVESKGNSDLSERDIQRMADYGRWLGNPTRSEVQVSQPEVVAGEAIFKKLQCDTCHVIKKINIDYKDTETVLSKNFRARLETQTKAGHIPFLSYIGTDLLMHDMGYLSQVGDAGPNSIRDATTSLVKPGSEAYVQKVRTPPLKGLRFNNYVTDAHRNTKKTGDPGCDFLLHDGRACDAIEAAFLHDGPAIKVLQVIEGLNKLQAFEVMQLRAFLYSL